MNRKKLRKDAKFCFFVLIISLFLSTAARAEWQSIGNFLRVAEQNSNYVVLQTTNRAKVKIEFFEANVIRIRIAPKGIFERDFSYAIDDARKRQPPPVKLTQTPREIVLTNSFGEKIVVGKNPLTIEIFDAAGASILSDDKNRPVMFDDKTGEIQTSKLRKSEVETYYGFGEKAFAEMSRNGKYIVNWNSDTFAYPVGLDPIYQSIPFFYSLYKGKSYGVFFNNTFRSFFDMGKTSPARYVFGADGGEMDYFVFTGGRERSPKKVLEDYAKLTGKSGLPPVWALGNQQSRWSYFPESRVREIADGFRSRKIPADVIYLDIDYMDGYRVFTWDKTRFPNPRKLVSDLKADGFKTVLIIDPGIKVDDNYAAYADGKRAGVYVKNPDGTDLVRNVWAKESVFPDFTDPKAREWFGGQYKNHVAEGIAGFWNDMNEPATFMTEKTEKPEIFHNPDKTFPYDTLHAGDGLRDTHRRYHNVYGMLMTRSSFEGVKKLAPEKRPFILTRAGFAGVQRYSAVWTGDNVASWEHLRLTIPMLTNLSVSGVPFVGADVGGFAENPSGELYARWLQAAVLTPFLRSHSSAGTNNKEPWEYGEEFTKINRASVELRYQFLPYLYTLFYQHEQTGQPVLRPLWYEYPNDVKTYLRDDEYLVGRDLLVAPVLWEGRDIREVYFPEGDDWRDWQTGEIFKGGTSHWLKAPLDRLLVYARVGAVIPTQPVIQNTTEMPQADLTLNVITGISPDKTETAEIFQDAGEGYGYQSNARRIIKTEHQKGLLKINRAGDFQGQKLKYIEALGITQKPQEIKIDGKTAESKLDSQKKRLKIEVSDAAKEITLIP